MPLLELSLDKENSDATEKYIERYLALSLMHDVLAYPNNEKLTAVLTRFHRDLPLTQLSIAFCFRYHEGGKQRLSHNRNDDLEEELARKRTASVGESY